MSNEITDTNSSYVTQPRAPNGTNGFFLIDCAFTGATGVRNCYLGRMFSGYPYAQVVLLNCTMSNILFRSEGWYLNGTDPTNLRLWEYKSKDAYGNLIYVSGRINPGSRQLSDAEAVQWRDVNNVFALNPWNPKTPEMPTVSWMPEPAEETALGNTASITLKWASGARTTSHLIYLGTTNPPELAIEQAGKSFETGIMLPDTTYYWRVDEKNAAGITTGHLWNFTTGRFSCPSPLLWDVDGNCEINFLDFAEFAEEWATATLDFNDIAELAADWLICNRYPSEECWQ